MYGKNIAETSILDEDLLQISSLFITSSPMKISKFFSIPNPVCEHMMLRIDKVTLLYLLLRIY